MIISMIVCSILVAFLHILGMYKATTLLCATSFGMSCSGVYPMLFATPSQFNLKLTPQQVSTLMLLSNFAQFFITTTVGILMGWRTGMLLYSLAFLALIMGLTVRLLLSQMEEDSRQEESSYELK